MLCDHIKFEREFTQENKGYECGSESLNIPAPLRRASRICHFSIGENISFDPITLITTAAQHPKNPKSHSSVCHQLMFDSSDEESASPISSPLHSRTEPPSLAQCHMDYQHPSPLDTDNSFQDIANDEEKEDFPTVILYDDLWLEDPVPDRHLCIHEHSQSHFLCSYPCPYSLDPLPHTPRNAPASYYEMMDLSDISDFQDVMTTTSEEDIPDLDNVVGF